MDENINQEDRDRNELMEELQRMISCYQIASRDDKNVVWSVLNKYMPYVT